MLFYHKPLYKWFVLWKLFELYSELCRIWITNWNVIRSYWFDTIRHGFAQWRRFLVEKEIFRIRKSLILKLAWYRKLHCTEFKTQFYLFVWTNFIYLQQTCINQLVIHVFLIQTFIRLFLQILFCEYFDNFSTSPFNAFSTLIISLHWSLFHNFKI